MKNFAALELGRNLIRQSDGYLLVVPSAEVKNRQEVEQPIISRLTPYLDRYFAYHHPRLLQDGESKRLWINKYDGMMKPHAVGKTITKVTGKLVGAPISAHLFRHCAATTIAIGDNEHAMIIRAVLAHVLHRDRRTLLQSGQHRRGRPPPRGDARSAARKPRDHESLKGVLHMRAVIYARYSSENQRDASIEDQVRQCQGLIERRDWTFLHSCTDRGMTGASPFRVGYQKLLEDARTGVFDVVVSEGPRPAVTRPGGRRRALRETVVRRSADRYHHRGRVTDLHVGLKGTMNALYLKDLALKTRRGLEGRVRQGKSGGGLCYGYEVVREMYANGEAIRGGRRIKEAEAAVVARVFREFAAGRSPRAIARDLNDQGVPGPQGGLWRDTTIRGHRTRGTGLVNNELYIGRLVWNRQRYIKDPETGKRLARSNPPAEWIVEEVPHLRIVDQDLWDAVRRRQAEILATPAVQKIMESKFWTRRRARHLLTGLVYCGVCGARFTSVGRDYLGCGGARNSGNCGNRQSIRRPLLEHLIFDALKSRLMQPDAVREFI